MSYNNSKIEKGLSVKYEERAKQNKSSIDVNNKIVNADVNGSENFLKIKEGLSAKEKRASTKEISFKENYFLDRKYIQSMYDTNNAQAQSLFLESLGKRRAELNAYLLTGSKAHAERITEELKRINEIMDYFQPVIKKLVDNGVMQENGKGSNLFRID